MTPRISIIVTLFNRARFCSELLASIERQVLPGIELIIVDDGSTDGGPELCEQLLSAPRHDGNPIVRSLLLRQSNAGPGAARNAGLEVASGEYVTFLDSDDLLPPAALSQLYDVAEAHAADVVIGEALAFDAQGAQWPSRSHRNQGFFRAKETELTLRSRPGLLYLLGSNHRLIRRSILHASGVRFPREIRYGEDQPFMVGTFLAARQIAVIPNTVYLRRSDSADSLSRRPKASAYRDMLRSLQAVRRRLAEANARALQPRYDARVLTVDFLALVRGRAELPDHERRECEDILVEILEELSPRALLHVSARSHLQLLRHIAPLARASAKRRWGGRAS